ncbi:hypothetical protein [Sphingobium sp. B11D3D]|uniref:hypothetical protein n=1 Tax=Sphingobium sp. B11D3D TaxID=2940576 RepID=UPI0022244D80|nr:hypothetical protein [Sphingobium sp. B11D3D]MCW2370747.1 hypothetical protein [Sphingobium sp. B11D3D]
MADDSEMQERGAVCWAHGRTLGNIEVRSSELLSHLTAKRATNITMPCDFVYSGKYRHGAHRWWCRTHQSHWGTKSDLAALQSSNEIVCANHSQLMNYEVDPFSVYLDNYAEAGIWCSLPAALSTFEIKPRPPKIHVHLRDTPESCKCVDADFAAISAVYSTRHGLFSNDEIVRVDITPPAAFDFVCGLEAHQKMGCIECSYCKHPHLDLGEFGKTPHRKHFCANCGRDSTWSKGPIISTPLLPLHDRTVTHLTCLLPDRSLNLDDYKGHSYTVWASTPAIVWTASRPQEYGIHVHVHDGNERVIDDTFGEVILNGKPLMREELLQAMIDRAIV